jgi:hypothetical protein
MKKRLDVLLVTISGLLLALTIVVAKAHATCSAVCPSGYTQTGGSCPTVHGNCNSNKCLGSIQCQLVIGTNTFNTSVNCGCH